METKNSLEVPVLIPGSYRAVEISWLGRELEEQDFIAIAKEQLCEKLREGFVPAPGMTTEDFARHLAISHESIFKELAGRVLRKE